MSLSSFGTYKDNFGSDELTPEEKELIKQAEGAQGFGSATGTTAGGIVGGLASALIPGAQPFAPVIVPAASAIGNFIGGQIGGSIASDSANKFEKMREERLRELNKKNERISRTNELLGSWLSVKGM